MSIRSASDGERRKPAGEKGSTRVWKHVAMIFAVLVMSIANIGTAWGVEITINRFALNGTTILPLNTTSMFLQDEVDFAYSGTPSLSSGGLSIAASSTTTISAHGKTITGMTIVFNSANNTSTVNTGSITGWTNSNKTMAWSGSATSITITSGVATRINSAVITYTDATPLSGVSSTTLTTFIRPYNANNISIIGASKSPSAPGVNISGAFDSNVKLNNNASTNGTSTNAIRIVSPKAISSIVYTWSTAPTATQTSSGSYDSGTSTWTAANTTTTDVSLYNRGSAKAVFSKIVVNFVGSTPSCTSITPTWSTDYSSTTLNVGATSSTPVVGKDGSSGAVTFSSSDTYIATVNSSGVVTGVGAGTATITATVAADGGKCEGTVTKEFTIKAGVTYNANGADGGSVPTDASTYAYNANITVAGNTGSLYKTGFVFNGWNTRSDGTGTHYEAGATMKMPSKSAGVTLYAEWVGYATSWEWWNSGQSDGSKTFTYLTNKNYICSFKSSNDAAVASWDIAGTIVYRGVKMKTKDHYMYFWVPTGKRVSITFGYMSTKPTFTVGGVNKAGDLTTSTTDSATVTYTTTADTKFYIENETATKTAFTVKSVKIEDDATCPSAYSFHYGPATGDWETPICFEQVGSTHEWNITNFAIPDHTNGQFWVGYAGSTNGQSATKAWTDSYSESAGVGNGAMLLLPTNGSVVGNAVGATGTLVIWDNSSSKNQYVGFKPDGYSIRYSASDHVFAETATANMWETDVVTLPDVSTTYTMEIKTAGGYTTCYHSNAPEAISNMGVTNVAGGKKAIYLVPGSFNADGAKYAVYDVTNATFDTDFMTDDDGDGIYVGYVGSNCSSMILCRMNSDATTSDLSSNNWDKRWNQTANIGISGDLAKKYTITNMTTWNECGYTTANMQPITGQKGKFRMWANSNDNNWYVHFIPYYVLSYDANGGSGTTAATERNSESSTLTVSVASNGFTAPTGYSFKGWATSDSRADAGTVDYDPSDSYTLTANATLYAVWTPILVSSITVSPASKTLDVGGTQTLTATVAPATALDKAVTWSTSNGSIATVNASGVVTAVAPGSCTITATAHDGSGVTGTCSITVNKIQPTKYSFSVDKTTLCGGETATLTLAGSQSGVTYELREDSSTPIAETQKTGTGSALTWTGLGADTYVVYAVADATYTERQMDGSKITISTGTATSITTQPTNQEVTVGEEATLTVVAAGTSLSYQWKESATEDGTYSNVASGGTSSSYSVTPVAAGTKWYKCVVTGTCGTVTTEARKIVANAAVTYRVTYDAQGGSVTPAYEDVTTATLPTPTKTDYTFQGWYTSGGTLISGTYNPTADITLHALWREDECSGGGGGSTTLISITPTITNDNKNNGSASASGTPGGTAYWDKMGTSSPYKLNSNEAYFALKLSSGYYQATDVLVINGADKAHYVYYGSHGSGTALSATGNPSSGTINFTLTGLPSSVDEIYVYRSSDSYNGKLSSMSVTRAGGGGTCYYVTYNGNGADGGFTTDEASHASGSNVTVASNSFTKTGYRFTGWKTEPSGGTPYAAGGTISGISGNMTLYAQWEEDVCTPVDAPTALTCSAHTSSSLTFTWTQASNASGYTATLYSDSGCESEVTHQDLGDVATVTFTTLSASTTYYCKVQSHGDGSTYCTAGGTTSAQSGTTDAACTAHGLAYGTAAVAKNVGDAAFTNTLTNPHSLVVTYSSSNTSAATVNATSGMVTIEGAGETTITATWAGNATYCAGTATYTLTVSSGCTPQSLSKVSATKGTSGTVTGYNDEQYAGDAVVNLYSTKEQSASLSGVGTVNGYKMGDAGTSIVFATLKGTSFQAGDKVRIGITRRNDLRQVDSKYNILTIYYGTNKSDAAALTTITTGGDNDNSAEGSEGAGFYEYTLTSADVTAIGSKKGIGLFRESSNGENPYVYSVEIIGCREWATCTAPDAVAAGSVTGEGATFTITDALNTNNYEIYYSTSSTAPTAETSAIISGISTKSRAVTGLTAETTYYYWVRSNCGGATKSSWVAGTPASFTTEAAAATHNVTYNGNGSTGGSVPTDATAYEEGDVVTVLGNTGSLVKTGQTFLGWSTNATASSGTFYPAGYKFYMPNAAVTLYAVWGSAGEEKYYYGSITITTGALTPGSTGGHKGFFTNSGGTIATSSAISLSSTPSETGFYYESSTLTHTELSKSSNWNTSSSSKRTIRAFKFANNTSYTLALGSATATKITFYGKCGSASRILSVGGVEWTSNSTKETFEYHEFTKVGNFTGNVTIGSIDASSDNRGDFYGILVVTVSTGAGSNHTVTFNMNGKGSAIEPITDVPSGSKISAPIPSPTAVGAEFGGWYREAGCTNAWNFGSSTISKDTTLYAKWTTCAPSISAHPAAATYTQGAAATALSVTASGEGLNYQWYTSEDGSADIQGSSAIPGATSASYTPSTSLLGTIYYFCVVSNTCGNAVSNKAAITVNDSNPAPTAVWDIEEPKEGGKGFTFSIEVNKNDGDNWDGELLASMLTLSDNAIMDGSSIVVDNTNKTISGTYGVKAGSSSPVTFYLLLPATTSQSATRLDEDRTFTPCAGGAGDSYNVRVRKDYEKDASNNYRWVTAGAGEITYAVNSSISSAKASSAVGEFDSIMSNDKQYVWVKTYEANTKTIRLHVETSGANISVNALYKNTVYATAADKDIVSSDDYSVSYDGSGSAENTGAKGTHYMDITFDSPLAANDIICVKFSSSKVKAYGAVLTTVGDGGDQTTSLAWNTPSPSTPVTKNEDAADFSFTANRSNTEAQKSLGEISYSSSNTAVATVNATTGLVHIADAIDFGAADYKEVTITATLAASGCYKKASITYTLRVNKYVCADTPGTITYVDNGCSGMVLTLEGYEAGATVQWYKDGSPVGTNSATYNATEPGEYYAVSDKNCDITSTNSVKLERAAATAEKIVDSWYVKNGRRTPDIALVQTTGATSFTVTSGGTITEIGGCTFELKDDGIIYLHGQKEDGSAPSDMTAGDMTITITVSGCSGALSGLDITIHKQAETAKPSVAFVVDGTLRKDGGTATSVLAAKTSDRPLWTYLSSSYALTGCNVYWSVDSKELREYYSQFDAILITDDPNTQTKGTGGVPYVKAFGTMVDVRPILTMEAFVGRYSDGGWHVYNASPSSPNPRQVEMKLECKNHDIFKGLDPEASDNVRTTTDEHGNEHWHVIMVDTTVAPYHNTSKDYEALPALQGFDPHKFDHMLGVGTIADETLQGGVERQEEPAARMMILGIQNEAMAALTNEGKLIIKNAIEYLLKTNMEDVNDCSNYFTGGPSGTGDNWATAENWSSGKVPDFESRVRILRPVVISGDTKAIVARVDIATSGKSKWVDGECNGKVTVNSQGALIVGGKIRRAHAPLFGVDDLEPTENDDLIVKAEANPELPHKQGALIFDNSDGDTRAVVEMWNPSHWEVEGGKKKKYWSYVAVPIQEADIPNFFWYGFTYLYDETSGWIKKSDGTSLYPFQGIGASLQDGNMETFYGPLATTESQDITLTYTADKGQGMNLIGNSWTAPIQIANFEEDDFGDATATVWVFNTGDKNDGTPGSGSSTTDGQWNTIPINAPSLPGYEGLKVIPAMQAFEVNTASKTTLHLDYDRLVRAGREDLNEPMRAPRRGSAAKQIEATMRVRVSGELTHTDVYLLKDARFSDGFDNGWDGHFLSGDDRSAQLYAISEAEGELAFLAQPEIEGTQLGFAPSKKDTEYTFSFSYDGEEPLYLNDLKLKESTLIDAENTYLFTYEEGDAVNRFYISATPFEKPNIATGTETIGHPEKVQKVMYKDHIYIIRGGKVFDVVGKMVK